MWFRRRRIRFFDRAREARVLPEFASRYPALKPGRWAPVSQLVRRLRGQSSSVPRYFLDEHFEFRGGLAPRNPAWPFFRQRSDDEPAQVYGSGERVARLHSPYAHLYSGIRAEQWLLAREVRDTVISLRDAENADQPFRLRDTAQEGRALPDEHFEFRLGMSDPGMPRLRTRWEDPALRTPSPLRKR
jgi:hypothetical protein